MLRHDALALAFWLALSTEAHAIAFTFVTESVKGSDATLNIRYELTEPGSFELEADFFYPNGFTNIQASPRFLQLDLDYSLESYLVDFTVTQDTFTPEIIRDDFTPDDLSFSNGFLSHVVGDAALIGDAVADPPERWRFLLDTDDQEGPRSEITGCFVSVVSEPPVMALVAFALGAICWRFTASTRSACQLTP